MSDQPTERRCPMCGLRALPLQSHCRHCEARLPKAAPSSQARTKPDTYGLTADDHSTGDGRCPGCGSGLPAEAVVCVQCGFDRRIGNFRTTAVVAEESVQDVPVVQRRPRRLDRVAVGQLRLVQRGLTLHAARSLLGLLGILIIVGLETYLAVKPMKAEDVPPWIVLGATLGSGMWLLAIAFGFLGSTFCLCVPRASSAWFPIRTSLTFDIVAVGLGVTAAFGGWTPLLGLAFGLVSWALFMAFLVKLARYVERPSEAREARTILVYGLLLVVIPVVLALAATLAMDERPEGDLGARNVKSLIAVFLPFIAGIFFRIQLVMIRLLESLRESLRHQVEEAERMAEEFA